MESLLDRIHSPADLRTMSLEQLHIVAKDIRTMITETVARRGGHLASNLGVVELTLALHRTFDFATDRLVMDVGHQCYVHKIITGRRGRFDSLRQESGISGFPDPDESVYDPFRVGHAGTAVATALGLAKAEELAARQTRVVAMVGDGSVTNGLSFEGLNNAGLLDRQFLVVLNDNSMSIDVTTGGLARHMEKLRLTNAYSHVKHAANSLLEHMPMGGSIRDALAQLKSGLKSTIWPGQMFEHMGMAYIGPIDGHNLELLVELLGHLRTFPHPVLLHAHTNKGQGVPFAVRNPTTFHSPSAFKLQSHNEAVFPKKQTPTFTEVFSQSLCEQARKDTRIVAITAAMPDGTGLVPFREQFPKRYWDVGINESCAVAVAAGLAKQGYRPVVAMYSTFLQRAYDQVWQEASLQKLPIVFAIDRAGLVGSDGAVHHGFADIAFLRTLPGVVVAAPADAAELDSAMAFALSYNDGPVAVRYPRDYVPSNLDDTDVPFELGKGRWLRDGGDAIIVGFGTPAATALEAAGQLDTEGIDVGVVSARFAWPLDVELLADVFSRNVPVILAEDHSVAGGFGSAVLEAAQEHRWSTHQVHRVGMPSQRFIRHASRSQQLAAVGLDQTGLVRAVHTALQSGSDAPAQSAGRPRRVMRYQAS